MNWISETIRPKIRGLLRREVPDKLWIKCPETGQLVFAKDVEANQFVIPGSNYHMHMGAEARLKSMFDNQTWFDVALPRAAVDPLNFRDQRKRRYADRRKEVAAKTGLNDAIKVGYGRLEGMPMVIGVQDFTFMGGSLRMAAGDTTIEPLDHAVKHATPLVMFAASCSERIEDSILSLMQMSSTTIAVQMLREVKKPYIVVLTNP